MIYASILLALFAPASLGSNDVWATATEIPVYMLTTRDDRVQAEGVDRELGYNDKYPLGDINRLIEDCPEEIAIFVHGWQNDENKAKERLDRVKMSLEFRNYSIPLIGLSWDSDKDWDPAKSKAKEDGLKLARFISEYKDTCMRDLNKDVAIRLLGHSLGSRVILSALQGLHEDPSWNNDTNNFKVASVHLMGAAVDYWEVSKDSMGPGNDPIKFAYGNAIEAEVTRFYNLFDPKDNILEFVYPSFEENRALGEKGREPGIDKVLTPPYYDIDVQNKIESIADADRIPDQHFLVCPFSLDFCEITINDYDVGLCIGYTTWYTCGVTRGDNHGGYVGFRSDDNPNSLVSDGSMKVVVDSWKHT
jgi:pimeloyl-ACP methyl ester carboxylesterase